jgi:phosphoribosyl 1,2-cyclic phosphodiesterase
MRIKFWGVRGTIAAPGRSTLGVGGNTPCIEVRTATNALIVLDAGIGLCWLGRSLLPGPHGRGQGETTILLSRTHWDHIQGIPFFVPAFLKGNKIHIHGAALAGHAKKMDLHAILEGQMREAYSPIVTLGNMPSITSVRDVVSGEAFEVGGAMVRSHALERGVGDETASIAYRVEEEGRSLVYVSDVAYARGVPDAATVAFAKDADIVVHEAYYIADERDARPGPPTLRQPRHATFGEATDLAVRAGAKRLFFTHHHPDHDDDLIARSVEAERKRLRGMGSKLEVETAREGVELAV